LPVRRIDRRREGTFVLEVVLQIVVAIVVLVGLITVIMSIKNWHWAQVLLLLGIFFLSVGNLLFGLEVYRIHSSLRRKLPILEDQTVKLEEEIAAMQYGGPSLMLPRIFDEPLAFDVEAEGRMPSMAVWTRRLQDMERERGSVWRGVTPASAIDPQTNRLTVKLAEPLPHGLDQNSIVYMFEEGEPNAAAPQEGAQFLGEFRVVGVQPDTAELESVYRLDNRTGNRIASSTRPWVLYETMPRDQYQLFAGKTEEELRQMLPAATVEEYLRHGTPATPDDDDLHRAAFDDQDHRLGPESAGEAAKTLYDRQLRDYDYLFDAANRDYVELAAEQAALTEDAKKLAEAQAIATKVGEQRTAEKQGLTQDLAHLEQDVAAIRALLATIQRQAGNVQQRISRLLVENAQMANQLQQAQLGTTNNNFGAPQLNGAANAP
jgi:hypothetical protein